MDAVSVDQRVLEHFKKLLTTGRMGHAYLFVGPKEIGKTQTALCIAQLVNCESTEGKPCGRCSSCKKIIGANHPDVMILQEDEGSIKIDQIRLMMGRLQLKAYEAKTKVFIIRNVETMTLEAANSLLKTLEEPASHTLIILTTAVPEANLDTIRSRCHVVRFFSVSRSRLQKLLSDDTATMYQFLTVYTDGCVGRARQLVEDNFIVRKNQILDAFLYKNDDDSIKKFIYEKEDAKEALQIILSIVRDAILLKAGLAADELMHVDRLKDVRLLMNHSFEELFAIYEQMVKTKGLLDENLNARMAFSILRQRIWVN